MKLMQEELKKVLKYDPKSGVFVRIKKASNKGNKRLDKGYLRLRVAGRLYYAHRLAWLYVYGVFPVQQIDHKNHNRADNRILNLRDVTNEENSKNQKMSKLNKSGVTGVYFDRKRWRAQIKLEGKTTSLGSFVQFHEAVNARKNAEVLYGYHENHGSAK